MATHNLFRGGLRTNTGWEMRMFPSTDVEPNGAMEAAAHKTPVHYAISWGLAPGYQCQDSPIRQGFMAQASYFADHPIAVGDVINAVILPRFSSLVDLFYLNCCPQPGLTVEVRIRGNADSLGGNETTPAPITLATLDLGEVTWGSIIPLPATQPTGDGSADAEGGEESEANGYRDPGDVFVVGQPGTIFFNQNDMLQIVVTAIPEDGIDLNCLRFGLSPVTREYLRGDIIECLQCCGTMPAVPTSAVQN